MLKYDEKTDELIYLMPEEAQRYREKHESERPKKNKFVKQEKFTVKGSIKKIIAPQNEPPLFGFSDVHMMPVDTRCEQLNKGFYLPLGSVWEGIE